LKKLVSVGGDSRRAACSKDAENHFQRLLFLVMCVVLAKFEEKIKIM
jgi:hypothetical protein